MGCGLEVAHDLPQWSFRLMSSNAAITEPGVTYSAPDKPSIRWFVCFLLFLATTINYMDRSVFSLIEPLLHLPFMGWIPGLPHTQQAAFDNNFGNVLIAFQIASVSASCLPAASSTSWEPRRAMRSPSLSGHVPPSATLWLAP